MSGSLWLASSPLVNGSLNFRNCVGGTGSVGSPTTLQHGVFVTGSMAAPVISATDCYSGPGSNTDVGFYVNGGTVGSSATHLVSITGGSLGTGTGAVGVQVDTSGQIIVGNGGTISLNGSGGGLYNGTGATNRWG